MTNDERDTMKCALDALYAHGKRLPETDRAMNLLDACLQFDIVRKNLQHAKWVGLSDETYWEMWVESPSDVLRFAHAIEAKLKEKNSD